MKKNNVATVDASSAVRSIERSKSQEEACSVKEDDYEKIRTMRICDLLEFLIGEEGRVGGKSTSLSITSNMVWLKGRILENVMAAAARLGARKMSIKVDGDNIKISLPFESDNIAISNGVFVNVITGRGIYPYNDNVKIRRSKSDKSVTVSISQLGWAEE